MRRVYPTLGRFSAMMDRGGIPLAETKNAIDLSKNSKIRAVAIDFNLLIRSIQKEKEQTDIITEVDEEEKLLDGKKSDFGPDLGFLKGIESLLGVKVISDANEAVSASERDETKIILERGESMFSKDSGVKSFGNNLDAKVETIAEIKNQKSMEDYESSPLSHLDIRNKYAGKLRKKLTDGGGTSAIDMAKNQSKQNSAPRGDASDHFAARKIAMKDQSTTPKNEASKWLAKSGAASLLTFLNKRSMKIILLPTPNPDQVDPNEKDRIDNASERMGKMNDLKNQLPQVTFHLMISHGTCAKSILSEAFSHFEENAPSPSLLLSSSNKLLSKNYLVVSDRDDYLRNAKEHGMYSCRIRPKNARRGSVPSHYTVSGIEKVEDVVNELNGISFNAVLK